MQSLNMQLLDSSKIHEWCLLAIDEGKEKTAYTGGWNGNVLFSHAVAHTVS